MFLSWKDFSVSLFTSGVHWPSFYPLDIVYYHTIYLLRRQVIDMETNYLLMHASYIITDPLCGVTRLLILK